MALTNYCVVAKVVENASSNIPPPRAEDLYRCTAVGAENPQYIQSTHFSQPTIQQLPSHSENIYRPTISLLYSLPSLNTRFASPQPKTDLKESKK